MAENAALTELDAELMARAIELGHGGDPSPNPHSGALVAKGRDILGEGFHSLVGEDHAEVVALKAAGAKAKDATLYVTLEPCNHVGRTAPCADAVIASGVKRVVIGCLDPNPHVPGGEQKSYGKPGSRSSWAFSRRKRSG
jgi:diaminohydroxyphosphoribosylaminopyrimidine deaminase/5-amino-6-(5-phosphoribosylamino)uracil reductase